MKVELTKAAIEGWKRDGAQGVEMRKYIFAHEWETLCDLALKGLESARPEAATFSPVGMVKGNGEFTVYDRPIPDGEHVVYIPSPCESNDG